MTKQDHLLIYLHIPKTAGSTLKHIIRKQYRSGEVWFQTRNQMVPVLGTADKANELKCVGGHYWFGIHQQFNKPYKYITMLRHPIDRIASEYYYILGRPNHQAYSKVKTMSFMEFIDHFPLKSSNQQTRRISGLIQQPELQLAKKNIQNDFIVVGVSEMFDESVFLMKEACNWGDISFTSVNVTKNRPTLADIPKDVVEKLNEENKLDLELYNFAKTELVKKIENLDRDSKTKLQQFINQQSV
ncbi:sulfotransferase family 2 domain-containing protein [Bacillus sp. JJ1562]|uniref:sulfotransferase family 2 domain-containing protein n=1 Tax=Bacillus sp. JJ1562 TaxID=3122960 RepID=UPI003002F83B